MRKFTLAMAALLMCTFGATAQNLLSNWNGGTATGANSKPTDFGWASTSTESQQWSEANKSPGSRFVDYNVSGGHGTQSDNTYKFNGETFTERILWIRWGDSGFSRNSYYTYPISGLEAGKIYTFQWKYAWHNNDDHAPEITAAIVKSNDGITGQIASGIFSASSTKCELREGAYSFKVKESGDYFLSITANTGAMIGITDLSLKEVEPSEAITNLSVSSKAATFIKGYTEEQTVSVSGLILEDLTISSLDGITLSQNTITTDELDEGKSVDITLTYTGTESIFDQKITISNTSLSQDIVINALTPSGTNLMQFWDGNNGQGGYFTGFGSEPYLFGWGATDNVLWSTANSSAVTIRYFDITPEVAEYKDENDQPWEGRVLYLRWDGHAESTQSTIYSNKLNLKANQQYVFEGKYAWHGNGPENNDPSIFTIGINSAADNTGTSVFSNQYTIEKDNKLKLYNLKFTFTPETEGVYYLTILNNQPIVGSVAELNLREVEEGEIISELNVSVNSLTFNKDNLTQTFTITGNNLEGQTTISALSGLTFDKTTFTAEEIMAEKGVTVQVTHDGETLISNGEFTITSGTLSKKITVNAEGKEVGKLTISPATLSFDKDNMTRELVIKGENIQNPVTISALAGLSFSKTTLTAEEVQSEKGATITVTFDGKTAIENKTFAVTSGSLSETVTVNATPAGSGIDELMYVSGLNVYTNNQIFIDFILSNDDVIEFSIYNMKGALISYKKAAYPAGSNQETIDVKLTSGIYLLTVKDASGKKAAIKIRN